MHGSWLVSLLVQTHLLDDSLDERAGVSLIIDGEVVVEPDMLSLGPQDSGEDAMKGTHIEMLGKVLAHQSADTFLHLLRRLVGKGERHDAPRFQSLAQQIGYLIGEHTCLARTCASYHQRGSVDIFHSLALRFIQVVK